MKAERDNEGRTHTGARETRTEERRRDGDKSKLYFCVKFQFNHIRLPVTTQTLFKIFECEEIYAEDSTPSGRGNFRSASGRSLERRLERINEFNLAAVMPCKVRKSCSICLQKSASMKPRASHPKFGKIDKS